MNIWDQTKDLNKNKEKFTDRKLYGKRFWKNFLNTHDYFFVEFPLSMKNYSLPMGYFLYTSKSKKDYLKFVYKKKTYEEYLHSCKLIHETLCKFNYDIFKIRKDDLFRVKEFPQFCILIKELYQNGSYNYPCWRLSDGYVCSHPGQHLNFCKIFLGMPIKGWISFPKQQTQQSLQYLHGMNIIKKIKNNDDIIDILGTNVISACIQKYEDQQVPSLYPSIPRPTWSDYDGYGNTAWPWDDVWNFNEHMRKSNYIKIIDKVIQNPHSINKFVDIKTDFASKEIVINNFFAFLLSEQYEDENFKLKVARHT